MSKQIESCDRRDQTGEKELRRKHWKRGYNDTSVRCYECSNVTFEVQKPLFGGSKIVVICNCTSCCNY